MVAKKCALAARVSASKSRVMDFDFNSNNFRSPPNVVGTERVSAIQAYNAKVCGTFFGGSPSHINTPFLGVELEVELSDEDFYVRNAFLRRTYDTFLKFNTPTASFVLLKRDGSLRREGDGGFEICTNPATYEFHKQAWSAFFDNPNKLRLETSGRTGLHIHVSRNALTRLQAGKILNFVHNPDNALFLRKVAGRESNNFANYSTPATIKTVKQNFSHYAAVNTSLPHTIEFRIFAATLNYHRFLSYLEFVLALIQFSSNVSCADSKDRFAFLNFLNTPQNRLDFPHLIAYLYVNGYSASLNKSKSETILK